MVALPGGVGVARTSVARVWEDGTLCGPEITCDEQD